MEQRELFVTTVSSLRVEIYSISSTQIVEAKPNQTFFFLPVALNRKRHQFA